jgi:hypothetical protein
MGSTHFKAAELDERLYILFDINLDSVDLHHNAHLIVP